MKIQITKAVRSSGTLPTRLLAPTFVGFQGRGVPASWRTPASPSRKRRPAAVSAGMALGTTALDPLGGSMV